jgi:lipopolysaccharide/colanic/teichoic acid biosynthesis glycosyltransferase
MSGNILFVDDDEMLVKMTERILELEGYTVRSATNGAMALEIAREWEPDLVLLDVMMPSMNGFEVLRRLRSLSSTVMVPIVMVTAKGHIDDKRIGFESGADDYIVKPYDPVELKLRVAAHLRRFRMSSQPERYIPERVISVPLVLRRYRSGVFLRGYRITKRLFDLAISLMALPFALPLMALIALAVRLESPGPAIFAQERTGLNGRRFRMYKFRTMVQNAEELKPQYAHLNELSWPDFKITNDPRMTRTGRFLRRTSLDELPQLLNILRGDMSFVGPRPTSFKADTYQLWQTERLEVRPGLTGLWQVRGRSDIDFEERVEMDIEYIERQSWRLDIQILWQTFAAVLSSRGAH